MTSLRPGFRKTANYSRRSPLQTPTVYRLLISLSTGPSISSHQTRRFSLSILINLGFSSLTMEEKIWDLLDHNSWLFLISGHLLLVSFTSFSLLFFFKLKDFFSGFFIYFTVFLPRFLFLAWQVFRPECFVSMIILFSVPLG